MHVIGTAGHVDHGKSTLVEALTGIDPDRLAEEKQRGLTIDLGFAWLELPSGKSISIVDVPGHERFIKNMLAGVGGIDIALIVIAADEGVMPQTTEHIAIINLLEIPHGIVAITKKDLVDSDLLELVTEEAKDAIQNTTISNAPIIPISAATGENIPELSGLIDHIVTEIPGKKAGRNPRLSIDRSFSISGFGTVVTGTLIGDELHVGQSLELIPSGIEARVRGLESHQNKSEKAQPGSRVAVNLVGVEPDQITRGLTLTNPGWLKGTYAADVHLKIVQNAHMLVRHNLPITFYSLAAESTGRIRLLEHDEINPGGQGWAQVYLDHPLPLVRGDYFIIRSTTGTLGGGQIIDASPARHRRKHQPTIDKLNKLKDGSQLEILLESLSDDHPTPLKELLTGNFLSVDSQSDLMKELEKTTSARVLHEINGDVSLFSIKAWHKLLSKTHNTTSDYHSEFTLRKGIQKEELRNKLNLSTNLFPAFLQHLAVEGVVLVEDNHIRLPEHKILLSDKDASEQESILRLIENDGFASVNDLPKNPELIMYLSDIGQLIRINQEIILSPLAYKDMVQSIRIIIEENGKISVAEVRDKFQTSRKYALALMEYLDQQKMTRRVGDERVLR